MATVLLTEAEVAERLRCSSQQVKRLRLSGRPAFIPGRPPMIDEADLLAYLEAAKARVTTKAAQAAQPAQATDGITAARQRAVHAWLRRGPLRKS